MRLFDGEVRTVSSTSFVPGPMLTTQASNFSFFSLLRRLHQIIAHGFHAELAETIRKECAPGARDINQGNPRCGSLYRDKLRGYA